MPVKQPDNSQHKLVTLLRELQPVACNSLLLLFDEMSTVRTRVINIFHFLELLHY